MQRLEGLFRGYRTDIAAANKYRSVREKKPLSLCLSFHYDTRIGWFLSRTIPHRVLTVGKSIRDSRFDLYDPIPFGHVARGMERGWRRNEGGKEKRRNGERKSKEDSKEEVDRYCLSDRNYSIQDFISIERCGGQRKILFTRDLQFPFSLVSNRMEKKEGFEHTEEFFLLQFPGDT